jgi:glucosamine 6-phosphate synthetase-like amidotransferase/phosphosugar isomerase protein
MCGIFGFIGVPSENTRQVVTNLGLDNLVRGKDSSGLAYLNADTFKVTREVSPVDKFFKGKRAQNGLGSSNIIGHTRYATHGEVNWQNAHPFKHKDWIFAHNGVISNFESLNLKFRKHYKVDSQVIGHLLPDNLNLLEGSFAIVAFHISEPDKIYFWRMYSPLFIAISPEGTFFSSLEASLKKHLPGIAVKEVPNYSDGILTKDKMSYNVNPIILPNLLKGFWLMGPDTKGDYHAMLNADREEAFLKGFTRLSSRRSPEQGFVC